MKANQKIIITTSIIITIILILIIIFLSQMKQTSNITKDTKNDQTFKEDYYVSKPVSYIDSKITSDISQPTSRNLISYTHPSGTYSFNYADTWEFLPERADIGLRPKEYDGYDYNEVITVLLFPDKGGYPLSFNRIYDGGFDDSWEMLRLNNIDALYYNYSSPNLNNKIYWFNNGKDAVKLMFRSYTNFPTDGNSDNSKYYPDFEIILNSFKFNN